jgi:GDPmannose 4,6-dehydratase
LQQDSADDYVIATGMQHSVRQFCEIAADYLNLKLEWRGEGVDEIGYSKTLDRCIIKINPQFYRPAEVDTLLGDCTKAYRDLSWEPRILFEDMVKEMINYDLATV